MFKSWENKYTFQRYDLAEIQKPIKTEEGTEQTALPPFAEYLSPGHITRLFQL